MALLHQEGVSSELKVYIIMKSSEGAFCSNEELQAFMQTDGNKICWALVSRYGKTLDRDDAYQEAMIAIAKALAYYKEGSTKTKKTTYVWQAAYNQIKMLLREESTQKRLLEKSSVSADSCVLIGSATDTEEKLLDEITVTERSKALYTAIDCAGLTWEEYYIIRAHLSEQKQSDIAAYLGRSQSYVSKKRLAAMEKVRKFLLSAGWDGNSACFQVCS